MKKLTSTFLMTLFGILGVYAQKKNIHQEYAYISNIETQAGNHFVVADYVQYLSGKAALKAAIQHGEAEKEINQNGKTEWTLPNDYYILNDNKKLRTLKLAKNADYILIGSKKDLPRPSKQTFNDLKNNFEGKLYKISFHQNRIISKVEEIYLP